MPDTTAGLTHMVQSMLGEAVTPFNNANMHIGVGNGTTAFAAGQTDLQGASKARKAMDVGYPQRSGLTVTAKATFATGDANFAWEEWALFNGSSGGVMWNRVVENKGTKSSSSTVAFTVTHANSLA